ncbi:MAG TPA: UDP-3-O-acyl-N-acetylglucosamine deacetylase [Acidobacteriota bacterium]|nr:UDP-3-O-acyl-N-acetylglucosamine deacetylase [Acidobacteriota bacterium]
MQRTISKPVSVRGVGLHTGCQVSITLQPAPADTGIVFRRTDLQGFEIEALRKHVSRVVLATTLMKRGVMLSTVEHLLSALYGQGIDNCYVDIDSLEVPIMDGSARPFVEMLNKAGTRTQESERVYLQVERTLRLQEGDKYIEIRPFDGFRITYEIDFEHPAIGRQKLDLEVGSETYAREIAFARTFGFYDEVEQLLKSGLVRGGSLENAVVLSKDGIMNGELRAEDEFVRHKVLDLIGDISLCGHPVVGHVVAYKAGHALHTRLATELARNPALSRLCRESRLAPAV